MTDKVALSVLLPTFNSDIIATGAAMESLRDQDFANFECIVIDDSSDALVVDFLKEFCLSDKRFHYYRGPSQGLASALNYGICIANGSLIARADDTDISRRDRFALQVNFLDHNPDVGIVGSDIKVPTPNSWRIRKYPKNHMEIVFSFVYRCPIAHPSVVMRKEILDTLGCYDPKFKFCEDLELWLRLYRKGVIFSNVNQPLIEYNNNIFVRGRKHYIYNTLARLKNISNPLIFLSLIISLLHFIIPFRLREIIFKKFN